PEWTNGKLEGVLILDGMHYGEVASNASVDLTQTVTLEAWVKVDRFNNTWTPLVLKESANAVRTYGLWLNNAGAVYLDTNDSSGNQAIQSAGGLIGVNDWHHIAGVLDRTKNVMRLYVDGVEVKNGTLRSG